MEFDWDSANVEHIARHQVTPAEVEESMGDAAAVPVPAHSGAGGERRTGVIGRTADGRVLAVVVTRRGYRQRVVTARPASRIKRARYLAAQNAQKER